MDQAAHTAAVQPDRANDRKNGQNIIIYLSRIRLFDLAETVVGRSRVLAELRTKSHILHMFTSSLYQINKYFINHGPYFRVTRHYHNIKIITTLFVGLDKPFFQLNALHRTFADLIKVWFSFFVFYLIFPKMRFIIRFICKKK